MLARVHIRSRPAEFIHIQTEGQKNVEQDEHAQRGYDGYHRRVLLHPYGEQFVMDMVLVRQEGFCRCVPDAGTPGPHRSTEPAAVRKPTS